MKIRPLTFSIVGKPAMEALDILTFVPTKSARFMLKTLKSAIANAENNHNLSAAKLIVQEAHVDDAKPLKRSNPQARGSAHPIKKRSSHIRIILSDAPVPEKTTRMQRRAAKKAKGNEVAPKAEGKKGAK